MSNLQKNRYPKQGRGDSRGRGRKLWTGQNRFKSHPYKKRFQSDQNYSSEIEDTPNYRSTSPTPSSWSLSTTATFSNNVTEGQFSDMCSDFRQNELNQMERQQMITECLFMERVINFLDDRCKELETQKSDNAKAEDGVEFEISDLEKLGIDPMSKIENIREHLNLIEIQVGERMKQLNTENSSIREKCDSVISGISSIRDNFTEAKSENL